MGNLTIQYGPWSPDLQNIATEVQGGGVIPCADVLNVYYQDGAYRCIPSPVPQGAANSLQCLNAFTWYDNVASQEVIFEGTSDGINALIDGLQNPIGVESSVTVIGVGISARFSFSGSQSAQPVRAAFTLGKGIASGGALLNATIVPGLVVVNQNTKIGYIYGSLGSLSPVKDSNGHSVITVEQLVTSHGGFGTVYTLIFQMAGSFTQSYFSTLAIAGASLATNTATFQVSGGVSQWTWGAQVQLIAGTPATVKMIL